MSDLRELSADVAIIGRQMDMVVSRPGARIGFFVICHAGYMGSTNDYLYHIELDVYHT